MWRMLFLVVLVAMNLGCLGNRAPSNIERFERTMMVTGYCDCKVCTGWKRNWMLRPVFASGPNKRKKVGVTASGEKARRGTIAADTKYFPFGTQMYIPGYGKGRVEDVGSAIKGDHIDVFFKNHDDARRWGVRTLKVTVWMPR